MSELVLPTLEEVDEKAKSWRRSVINLNVKKVVEDITNTGEYSGKTYLEWVDSTMSTDENILDCIVGRLERLNPPNTWYFRKGPSRYIYTIEWRSTPFPLDKPKWRFW